ncbi:MAG: monoacylglycerol lipase [Halioglobus sp.]
MQYSEDRFNGAGGATIHFQYWLPDADARAVILIAHGAAEHGGRYQPFAEHFTERGYAVAALDQFGHGRSDGGRCCMRSMDDHLYNFAQFRQRMTERLPGLPLVLLGHSMGGLIACLLLLQEQDKYVACVLSGAAIKTPMQPPAWQLVLLKLLSRLAPNLGVMQLDASGVSRDQAVVEDYIRDPLNHRGKMTARMVVELFRGMQVVQQRAAEIHLPLLILHGGADAMTSAEGSEFLHNHAGSKDRALSIYPGLYHEIFNEPERLQVYSDVESWLSQRLGGPSA